MNTHYLSCILCMMVVSQGLLGIELDSTVRALKEKGDASLQQNALEKAASYYVEAYNADSLKHTLTSETTRKMAVAIAWAKQYDDSIMMLNALIQANPNDDASRTELARILSWKGDLKGANEQIGIVLNHAPQNKDALKIKADLLRWNGKNNDAINIYQALLHDENQFDTRIGLAHAYVSLGEFEKAQAIRSSTLCSLPYQEKELKELEARINKEQKCYQKRPIRHEITFPQMSYFKDTDSNEATRLEGGYAFFGDNFTLRSVYQKTLAESDTQKAHADMLNVDVSVPLDNNWNVSAGAGLQELNGGQKTITHGAISHSNQNYSLYAGLSKNYLTDTAALINNKIGMTTYALAGTYSITDTLIGSATYNYRDYTDNNFANDFLAGLRYRYLREDPSLDIGYRIRYLNYDRQSGGGYFDPEQFLSHQFYLSASKQIECTTISIEPYFGHQSYRRYALDHNDWFWGGSLLLRQQITPNIAAQLNAEGGNYAMGQTVGYDYYLVGGKLIFSF